jgi:hypothetical protein
MRMLQPPFGGRAGPGPAGGDASLRRIDQSFVVASKTELLIVTYSATGVPELLRALRRAAERDVRVTSSKTSRRPSSPKSRPSLWATRHQAPAFWRGLSPRVPPPKAGPHLDGGCRY